MNYIKVSSLALLAVAMLAACSDDIDVNSVNETPYEMPEGNIAFLTDKYGCSNADSIIFNEKGSTDFYVNTTEVATAEQTYTIAYDAAALANYNKANGTNFQALPQELVTIDGQAKLSAGDTKSSKVSVSYTSAEKLDTNAVYAIPLKVSGTAAKTSEQGGEFVLLARDITKMPNCHKASGLQVISCMEINDANPLYNLCFTLKDSKKYFFDQVILFSGNINYNPETKEVYNYNNENITQCLQYKEKYLEPLQQKGMKVILGILGNHDRATMTGLNDEACRAFAQELKAVLNAYDLDGVFFDDEYSNGGNYPGFVLYNNWSRLAYECKKAMPDKLIEAYIYGGTRSASEIDGHKPGEFVDYGIHDYGGMSDLSGNFPGMPKSGMILGSVECARGAMGSLSRFEQIRNGGFGGTMLFALAPGNRTPLRVMNNISQAFYGEEVIQTGTYAKDW